MTGAIAIWVKTPGLSPVKTRLAATIGTEAAEEFYQLSAQAVAAVVRNAASNSPGFVTPYWAVAEADAVSNPAWREFPTIYQGEGGLGARLSHVYATLLQQHPWVIFVGADAPQITAELLGEAAQILDRSKDFVIGPAEDGGYYLFGGATPVARALWVAVPYSASNTLSVFADLLRPVGTIRYLPSLFDVDTADDLARLRPLLAATPGLTPEQHRLRNLLP